MLNSMQKSFPTSRLHKNYMKWIRIAWIRTVLNRLDTNRDAITLYNHCVNAGFKLLSLPGAAKRSVMLMIRREVQKQAAYILLKSYTG